MKLFIIAIYTQLAKRDKDQKVLLKKYKWNIPAMLEMKRTKSFFFANWNKKGKRMIFRELHFSFHVHLMPISIS